MRNVVCRICAATVEAPDDLAHPHCVRCGHALTDTHFTSALPPSVSSPAIQPAAVVERIPGNLNAPIELPERYADWDEFRTMSPTVQATWAKLGMRALPDIRGAEREPLPENIPALVDDIGKPLASLRMPGDNRFVIHCVSLAMVVPSIFVAFAVLSRAPRIHPDAWGHQRAALFAGAWVIGGLAFAYWLSFWRAANHPVTFWLFDDGILWQRAGKVEACRWADIRALEVSNESGNFRRLWLTLRPDFRASITPMNRPVLMPFLEYITTKAEAAQFLPCLRRIIEGKRVKFGVIALDRVGFASPGFFMPWSEINKVVADPIHLLVDGKTRPVWHSVRYQGVSFAAVATAIAHILIEEHGRLPPVAG